MIKATRNRTWFVCLLTALWAVAPAAAEEPAPLAEFTFPEDIVIVLPVQIEGREYLFLLDTGTTPLLFDTSLKHLLGEQVYEVTPGGPPMNWLPRSPYPVQQTGWNDGRFGDPTSTVGLPFQQTPRIGDPPGTISLHTPTQLYQPPRTKLGNLELGKFSGAACRDLQLVREVIGRDIRGIIGSEALKRYVVQIDFDARRVRLFAPGMTSDAWGTSTRMIESQSQSYTVPMTLGSHTRLFILHTGCSHMLLNRELTDRLFADKAANVAPESFGISLAGEHTSTGFWIGRTRCGSHEQLQLHADTGEMNAVGLGYLARYCVTFDFPGSTLRLKPGRVDRPAETRDDSGMFLRRIDDRIVVDVVDANGPAKEAGIRKGDVLTRIDGVDADSLSLYEIRRRLHGEPGTKTRLHLERDKKRVKATLTWKVE